MGSSFIKLVLARPFFIYSFLSLFIFMGIIGYMKLDRNLFPDSNRPEIALVAVLPSASAKDIGSNVVVPIEEELYTIDKIRRVSSSTIDEVSVIRAEFEYGKDIGEAAIEVKNSFDKVKSRLPSELLEPQIFKITQATPPVTVIALSSDKMSLQELRELAQNSIKKRLLGVAGVANVEIFGGYKNELQITLNKQKLDALNISFGDVVGAIKNSNKDYSIGAIDDGESRFLLKSANQKEQIYAISNIPITNSIFLKDIATIGFDFSKNQALYFGNGKEAIALSIQRGLESDVVTTIKNTNIEIKKLREEYSNIAFEVTDTQETLITQSTENMFGALEDAILFSTIVVLLFLASLRQIVVILLTIPVVYISTISIMYLLGIDFNVITLTAIILALGLLLDDTVVVVENIERHYSAMKKEIESAVSEGTSEIMFADFSGTITTVVAIFPILFVGDYPQTVFGPLIGVLLIALFVSYIVSITFVPLISKKVLAINSTLLDSIEERLIKFSASFNDIFINFFTNAFRSALHSKKVAAAYFVVLGVLFFVSIKVVMPLAGQELMPAMDTGAIKIKITTDSNLAINQSQKILKNVEEILKKSGNLQTTSSSIGSEAGVLSIGSGGGVNEILIIANYINRFEREEDIWSIQRKLREKISAIPNIKRLEVSDSGATAMASIKANLTVTLYGENLNELYQKALEYEAAMKKTKGVVNVSKSWDMDTISYQLDINPQKMRYFGLNEAQITDTLKLYLKGASIGSLPVLNSSGTPIKIELKDDQTDTLKKIESMLIDSKLGKIPLSSVATVRILNEPQIITREGLNYTIDILGFREKAAISHLQDNFDEVAKDITLPSSITMKHNGDISQFKDSSVRIIKAVAIGLILVFIIMVPMFESLKVPFLIILSIPLTIAGAAWILILLDYHSSMSAMIGFVLLAGVIVNNAILLIHFALEEMKNGLSDVEAMMESIRLRTRPVLMTAISVSAGMIPVAMGWAIGLERLAPLGAVVLGGLVVGTLLTLVFIPLFFVYAKVGKLDIHQ